MKIIKNKRGFTLVEMMIVLLIVSVLSLLIIPNVNQTKSAVNEKGKYALSQLVQTQISLYKFENGESEEVDLELLAEEEYITEKQKKKAIEWGIPY